MSQRTAIVTGVSRGLGHALAAELLSRGFEVVGIGRSAGPGLEGAHFALVRCDLAEPMGIAPVVEPVLRRIAATRPAAVTLINNAALSGPMGRVGELDLAASLETLNVNLAAPLALVDVFCRVFVDEAVDRRIVNISSGAAQRALPGNAVYPITKAGLEMLTLVVAADFESPTLRCISLRPGVIETDMQRAMRAMDPAEYPIVAMFRGFKEQGLLKEPHEVAAKIVDRLVLGGIEHGRTYLHTELG